MHQKAYYQRQISHFLKKKKRKRKEEKWYQWQLSQEASRSERKLKKERFWFQNYRFDDLTKGKECYQIKEYDQLVSTFLVIYLSIPYTKW